MRSNRFCCAKAPAGNLPAIMVAQLPERQSTIAAGGPVSRLREARRRVALFAPRDSPRASS